MKNLLKVNFFFILQFFNPIKKYQLLLTTIDEKLIELFTTSQFMQLLPI